MTHSKFNPGGTYESRIEDLAEFRSRTLAVGGPDAVVVVDDALRWVERCGGGWVLGRGLVRGPLYLAVLDRDHQPVKVLAIDTDGGVSVNYNHICSHSPYGDVDERLSVNRLLNEIDGILIDDDYAVRCSWPKVRLDALRPQATRVAFFRIFDGVATRLLEAATS
jgi:hypothetical protein